MSIPRKAAVHDLGYQRYAGIRRPQRTRYQVIVRNLLSMSWKGWWRYKLDLALAVLIVAIIGGVMYFSRGQMLSNSPVGAQFRTVADSMIPQSFSRFAHVTFILAITILAGAISSDLKAGAFEFYFSRPVRPLDYVLGKVGGAFLLLVPILVIAPLLLTLFRMGLTGDVDQALETLPWIPKAILVGTIASLTFAALPLAIGSLSSKPSYAIAGYGAFVFVFGGMVAALANGLQMQELAALNPFAALEGLSQGVFDVPFLFSSTPSLMASALSLLGYTVLSIGIIYWRVTAAQKAGMGGG